MPGAEQLGADSPDTHLHINGAAEAKAGAFWQLLYEFPEQNRKYAVTSVTSASFLR